MSGTDTYVYDRNRRFTVSAGTRCASTVITLRPWESRVDATARAIRDAIAAWVLEWGEVPWDLVQIVVNHVTTQVAVEFRAEVES